MPHGEGPLGLNSLRLIWYSLSRFLAAFTTMPPLCIMQAPADAGVTDHHPA